MGANIIKEWEHGQKDLTALATAYKITTLRGGESITIKALVANTGNAYIGSDRFVSTTNGFELDSSQTLTLTLPASFGTNNCIEIYACTSNAGDDICWVKLINLEPETAAA
jgi:hypothetical protein